MHALNKNYIRNIEEDVIFTFFFLFQYCKYGKCVNMTIMSTTVSTIETTTPLDEYKSPIERCKHISMAWIYDVSIKINVD